MSSIRAGTRGNVPRVKEKDFVPSPPIFPGVDDLATTSTHDTNIASLLAGTNVIIILPIIFVVLAVCLLRECYLANRRDAARRHRSDQRAATQEKRRTEAQKARSKVIESALIIKVNVV